MRILEEFWYGNINPVEIPFQRQRQFDKVFKLLTKNEEKLNTAAELNTLAVSN